MHHFIEIMTRSSLKYTHHKYLPFDLTKASAKFEVVTSNGLEGDAFTRKYLFHF